MSEAPFDQAAWLGRIGYDGPRAPTLPVLRGVIAAQSGTIPFENLDVLLGRVPRLDGASLQRKLVDEKRGGYCFEINALLRMGLVSLGFTVTRLLARVIIGLDADVARAATHMALRVDLPEGAFLADTGFGNLTPTAPLAMVPDLAQATPHETMRLAAQGTELVLQVNLGSEWRNLYRLAPEPKLDADYEVANWFTATHPASPFVANLVASRPMPDGARYTLFNGRLTLRRLGLPVERVMLADDPAWAAALAAHFGLRVTDADLTATLAALDRHGNRGVAHPFFD